MRHLLMTSLSWARQCAKCLRKSLCHPYSRSVNQMWDPHFTSTGLEAERCSSSQSHAVSGRARPKLGSAHSECKGKVVQGGGCVTVDLGVT